MTAKNKNNLSKAPAKSAKMKALAVQVAKDVIKQLDRGKIYPESGRGYAPYLLEDAEEALVWIGENGKLDLKKYIEKIFNNTSSTCQVCALGSIFVSMVHTNNNCVVTQEEIDNDLTLEPRHKKFDDQVTKAFTARELDLIESAFEGETFYSYESYCPEYELSSDDLEMSTLADEDFAEVNDIPIGIVKSIRFGMQYIDDTQRLRAIMNNVIKNKGAFVP